MRPTVAERKRRKAALKASGHTYDDLARLAGVSWRMVKFWIDGQRTSAPILTAFETLTHATTPAAPENGRQSSRSATAKVGG